MDPNLAIALAIPFGVIGVFLDQLRRAERGMGAYGR
jgi:D-glucosaminate-specific PTS system IIC component